MSKVIDNNNGYFTFSAIDIQGDGSFAYAHERVPPEHLEDMTPKFSNLNYFTLNNNIYEKKGVFPIELWNNTITIKRFPVWNNKVVFEGVVMFNNQRNDHPNGFLFMKGIVNTKPFEIRVTDAGKFNQPVKFYILFNNSGNIRVNFSPVYDSSSHASTTVEVNYGASFTGIEEIEIGGGEDISLYYFIGANDSIRVYTSTILNEYVPKFFREWDNYTSVNYLSGIKNETFELFTPGIGNFYYRYNLFRENYVNLYQTYNWQVYKSWTNVHLGLNNSSCFLNQNRQVVYPRIVYHRQTSFRLYPQQNYYLVKVMRDYHNFSAFCFTPLQEMNDNTVILEVRKSKSDNYGLNQFGDDAELIIYPNRIEYKTKTGTTLKTVSPSYIVDHIRFLRRNTIFLYKNIQGHLTIRINNWEYVLTDYIAGGNAFSGYYSQMRYILFNGTPERNSILMDIHSWFSGNIKAESYAIDNQYHTKVINHYIDLVKHEEDTLRKPYINQNNITDLYKDNYSVFNKFDNIDADGVIKSVGSASDVIYPSKDWNRLTTYLPVPYEYTSEEDFLRIIGKRFVARKIKTKKQTQEEFTNRIPIFKGCISVSNIHADNSPLIYTQYKNDRSQPMLLESVLYAFDRPPTSTDVNNVKYEISYNKVMLGNIVKQFQNNINHQSPLQFYGKNYSNYFPPSTMININYYSNNVNYHYITETINGSFTLNHNYNLCINIGGYNNNPQDEWIYHFSYSNSQESHITTGRIITSLWTHLRETGKVGYQLYKEAPYTTTEVQEWYESNSWKGYFPDNTDYDPRYDINYYMKSFKFIETSDNNVETQPYTPNNTLFIVDNTATEYGYQVYDNTNYRIYGKVNYDGEAKEGMFISLSPSIEDLVSQPVLHTRTDSNGEYQFLLDTKNGLYKVVCEDPEGKYNTQIKDYTIVEENNDTSVISKNEVTGTYDINYKALYTKRVIQP